MEPAATASALAVALYIFHDSLTSPAPTIVELREGIYRVDHLRSHVTAAAKKVAEAFSSLQLCSGSLFVVDRPRNEAGKYTRPPRQEGEGLEVDELVGIASGKCILLDIRECEWLAPQPSPAFARPLTLHARPLQVCRLLLLLAVVVAVVLQQQQPQGPSTLCQTGRCPTSFARL